MLPVGGIIVGGIALLLAAYAAVTLAQVKKAVAEQDTKLAKIEDVERAANSAASAAEGVRKELGQRMREVQEGFNTVGTALSDMRGTVTKLEEASKKPAVAEKAGKKGGEPVVAGPGEYIVKPGDTGMKIASANHVSVGDLQAVNPGVNWSKLRPGDKVKLPASAKK